MKASINKNYFFLFILLMFSFCTYKRTVRRIASDPVYLEKKGKYYNLFYKTRESKFVLVADSVRSVITYDSLFAYSRVNLNTYPDMIIVLPNERDSLIKRYVNGMDFQKVFSSYFDSPMSTKTSSTNDIYDFLSGEEVIEEKNIVKQL